MPKLTIEHQVNIPKQSVRDCLSEMQRGENSISLQQIKDAVQKGALWLQANNQKKVARIRRLKKEVNLGDKLFLYIDSQVLDQPCPSAQSIADFNHYSVLYKPYGMLCQGSKWSDHTTITRWCEQHLTPKRPAFIVHRLDRAASGLILIAHSKSAAQKLSALFEKRKISKQYQIIVEGKLTESPTTVTLPIDGKPATSHFSQKDTSSNKSVSLLDVDIESGRKHQIRIHAASIGLPVVGDRFHGSGENQAVDLQLCAVKLSFICPFTNEEKEINLPDSLKPNLANIKD